jgi:hypothetical protein
MNTALAMVLAALAAVVLVGGQWGLQRSLQRRALDALKSRHAQQQLNLTRKLDQAKRQIPQLQQELAAVRLELKQRRERSAPPPEPAPPVPTRESLIRELDAVPPRPKLPVDGFADTLPSLQYAHAEELLVR